MSRRLSWVRIVIIVLLLAAMAWRRLRPASLAPRDAHELVVRVLDVGQGDAIYVENGGSRVLIDGGPDTLTLGKWLDALGLDGDTIDVVILTHAHADHFNGLREIFHTDRHIAVRYYFDAKDVSTSHTLMRL